MIFKQKFLLHLLKCLKDSEYLLFEHFAMYKSVSDLPFNFLLRKKDHHQVINFIKSFSEVGTVSSSQKESCTQFKIVFRKGAKIKLNLWENLSHNNLVFMNLEKVFSKRQRSKSEFYMPNVEDLFEFAVLNSFLNDQGLPIQYLNYFKDFHFFVKEGLLEFFNNKYQTNFSNLDDLSGFDLRTKESILNKLEEVPNNQLPKNINTQLNKPRGNNYCQK